MIQNKPNEERAGWHNSGSTNLEEVRSLDAIVCLPVWLNTTNIHNLDLVKRGSTLPRWILYCVGYKYTLIREHNTVNGYVRSQDISKITI